MASNLDCVGLPVRSQDELAAVVRDLLPLAAPVGEAGGVSVHRWEDPSGARLLVGLAGHSVEDFLPSYAAEPGVRFGALAPRHDDVWSATVVDDDGEQTTSMAVAVEEHRLLAAGPLPWSGLAAVTGLGSSVTVHADAEAFGASDASLLVPERKDEPPPPHVVERGLKWPPRLGAESFLSPGLFGPPEASHAYATLTGRVLRAERRVNSYSGVAFVIARVACLGFEVTVCLPAAEHDVPAPGNVVSGRMFLVASTGAGGG